MTWQLNICQKPSRWVSLTAPPIPVSAARSATREIPSASEVCQLCGGVLGPPCAFPRTAPSPPRRPDAAPRERRMSPTYGGRRLRFASLPITTSCSRGRRIASKYHVHRPTCARPGCTPRLHDGVVGAGSRPEAVLCWEKSGSTSVAGLQRGLLMNRFPPRSECQACAFRRWPSYKLAVSPAPADVPCEQLLAQPCPVFAPDVRQLTHRHPSIRDCPCSFSLARGDPTFLGFATFSIRSLAPERSFPCVAVRASSLRFPVGLHPYRQRHAPVAWSSEAFCLRDACSFRSPSRSVLRGPRRYYDLADFSPAFAPSPFRAQGRESPR